MGWPLPLAAAGGTSATDPGAGAGGGFIALISSSTTRNSSPRLSTRPFTLTILRGSSSATLFSKTSFQTIASMLEVRSSSTTTAKGFPSFLVNLRSTETSQPAAWKPALSSSSASDMTGVNFELLKTSR